MNVSRSHRSPRLRGALAVVALALAACGGGGGSGGGERSPQDALAALSDTCTEAAATLSAAPAPIDDATEEEFRAAHQVAVSSVRTATREALDEVDDPALNRMERVLDGRFPVVQGGWTAQTTAAQTLGSIDALDRHATAAEVPACAAGLWRASDWEAIYDRQVGERPSEEAFVAEVEALCASTLTFTTLGESGDVGAAVAASTARSGLRDFLSAAREVVPPESVQPEFFALIGAAADLQAAVPDAAPTAANVDAVQARIVLAADDAQAAVDALGVTC